MQLLRDRPEGICRPHVTLKHLFQILAWSGIKVVFKRLCVRQRAPTASVRITAFV